MYRGSPSDDGFDDPSDDRPDNRHNGDFQSGGRHSGSHRIPERGAYSPLSGFYGRRDHPDDDIDYLDDFAEDDIAGIDDVGATRERRLDSLDSLDDFDRLDDPDPDDRLDDDLADGDDDSDDVDRRRPKDRSRPRLPKPGNLTSYLRSVTSRGGDSVEADEPGTPQVRAAQARAAQPWLGRLSTPANLSEYAGYAVVAFVVMMVAMIFIVLLLNR